MDYIGDYAEDATVYIFFTTNDGSGGAVAPSSAFEAADIEIYKDNSATQKATTNGLTMTSPFDSITGLHLLSIDTSDDTGDAGFWATGSDYTVVLNPDETVDSQTVVAVLAQFSIENRTSFPKADYPTNFASMGIESDGHVHGDVKEWLGAAPLALSSQRVQTEVAAMASAVITAGVIATDAIGAAELATDAVNELRDALLDRALSGNHDTAGTTGAFLQNLDALLSDVETDTQDIQSRLPVALVSGKMDSDMTAISGDTTAADRLEALMDGIIVAQVNDVSATTTAFAADGFTEATDDHFNGRLITFITGALAGQQTDITGYDAAGGTQGSQEFTVTALTEAPANDDFFVIH